MEESKKNQPSGESRVKDYEVGDKRPPKEHQFSSTKRPTKEQLEKAKETRKRTKEIRDIIKDCLRARYVIEDDRVKEQLKRVYGNKANRMSSAELGVFQQINKMILKSDTNAFNSLINQGYGMPKQVNEITVPEPETNKMTTEQLNERLKEVVQRLKDAE